MKKLIFFIMSISTALYVNAQELDTLMVKANTLLTENKFQEAVDSYENIIKLGYESPELYYNLGNAYYKQNVIAKAILNYEKALLLDPNDADIKYNLELTNRLVVDKIEKLPVFFLTSWINGIKNLFSSDFWAIISIMSFILALIFISFFLYSRSLGFKKISFWIGFFIILISFVSYLFSYQQKLKIISGNSAIIISPSVTVKSAPDMSGTDLFVLHEGTKISLGDKISDWSEIKLSDGSKGWLKIEDFEVI